MIRESNKEDYSFLVSVSKAGIINASQKKTDSKGIPSDFIENGKIDSEFNVEAESAVL